MERLAYFCDICGASSKKEELRQVTARYQANMLVVDACPYCRGEIEDDEVEMCMECGEEIVAGLSDQFLCANGLSRYVSG